MTNNKGYYIGRYEAGDNISITDRDSESSQTNSIVCKKEVKAYNYIIQQNATKLAGKMYKTTKFTSDLINSYAWDTAIVFEQTVDNRTDKSKSYSMQNSLNTTLSTITGTSDKTCNIYDMASNVIEWTTETYSNPENPCVYRGGFYSYSNSYTSYRYYRSTSYSYDGVGFRPLLYVALNP